jgi:hypothetical protein
MLKTINSPRQARDICRHTSQKRATFSPVSDSNETNSGLLGTQPRDTLVESNLCHEIGHYQKQSSCFFQVRDLVFLFLGPFAPRFIRGAFRSAFNSWNFSRLLVSGAKR